MQETRWDEDSSKVKARRERRRNITLAPTLKAMHDGGMSFRKIERQVGVPKSTAFRLVKFQRKREETEAGAPPGMLQWAERLTCPRCEAEGMAVRFGKRGWGAGCWFYAMEYCQGWVQWNGGSVPLSQPSIHPQPKEPEPGQGGDSESEDVIGNGHRKLTEEEAEEAWEKALNEGRVIFSAPVQ